ncbi:glycoside hydrolase family 16 protein [Nocardioides marmoraquaticus]
MGAVALGSLAVVVPGPVAAEEAAVTMKGETIRVEPGVSATKNVVQNDVVPGTPKRLSVVSKPAGTIATTDGWKLSVEVPSTGTYTFTYRVTTPTRSGQAKLTVISTEPDFTLKKQDDFTGPGLDKTQWEPFTTTCGCSADTQWDPSQVEVFGGTLKLHNRFVNGRWLSGGVGGWKDAFKNRYGKYEARIRYEKGFGHWAAALTWPDGKSGGKWPVDGELDFYEIFGESPWDQRGQMRQTLHYGEQVGGSHPQISAPVQKANFAAWQVAGVEWTPTSVTFTLNGRTTHTITSPGEAIPGKVMWMGFQNVIKRIDGKLPTPSADRDPVTFEVDWARIYTWNGS